MSEERDMKLLSHKNEDRIRQVVLMGISGAYTNSARRVIWMVLETLGFEICKECEGHGSIAPMRAICGHCQGLGATRRKDAA